MYKNTVTNKNEHQTKKKYLCYFSFLYTNMDANTITLKEYVTLTIQYQCK